MTETATATATATETATAAVTELNERQLQAVESIVDSQATLVHGAAGTGKTQTLKAAIEALERAEKKYVLLAPTGKAALRITAATHRNATTIHRILYSANVDELLRNVDIMIVDEASMVDAELMGDLCKKAIEFECRIALVGDPNQLPPVGPGRPFEDALLARVVPTIELKTIYRQSGDSWVLDNAARVLAGEMVDLTNTHDFTFIETDAIEMQAIEYLGKRWSSGSHPSSFQVISPQRVDNQSYDSGATTGRINTQVQGMTDPDGPGVFDFEWGSKFRTGDRVIQTSNNYRAGVVNGQQGAVTRATPEGVAVKFDEMLDKEIWYSDLSHDEESPSPRELDLAFAITVHKSQGSQWPDIFFVADSKHGRMLQRRLFYTAITRTEKHLTIAGSRDAIQRAIRTNFVNERKTLLQEKLSGQLNWIGSPTHG